MNPNSQWTRIRRLNPVSPLLDCNSEKTTEHLLRQTEQSVKTEEKKEKEHSKILINQVILPVLSNIVLFSISKLKKHFRMLDDKLKLNAQDYTQIISDLDSVDLHLANEHSELSNGLSSLKIFRDKVFKVKEREYGKETIRTLHLLQYLIQMTSTMKEIIQDTTQYLLNSDLRMLQYNGTFPISSNDIQNIDRESFWFRVYPELISVIFYIPPETEFKVKEVELKALTSIVKKPTKVLNAQLFDYSVESKVSANPKIRYLPNWSYQSVKKEVERLEQLETLNHSENRDRIVFTGLLKMFRMLANQSRFGNLNQQLLGTFLWRQKEPESEYYSNLNFKKNFTTTKRAIDTVCWQAISDIFKEYSVQPFYSKKSEMYVNNDYDISMCLPSVIYSLLNGVAHEMTGVLNHETALLYLEYLMDCSRESLSTAQLNTKSDIRDLYKLFLDIHSYVNVALFSDDGHYDKSQYVLLNGEFWLDGEKERLNDILDNSSTITKKLFNYCLNMLDPVTTTNIHDFENRVNQYTETLRFVFITMYAVTNPGIYHKTSLLIEMTKSVGTVIKSHVPRMINTGYIKVDGKDVNIFYDVSGLTTNNTLYKLKNYMDRNWKKYVVDSLSTIDNFEESFVYYLTNRSGGVKSETAEDLPIKLQNVSNARVIHFALENSSFYDIDQFIKMLQVKAKCAIRYQIDRRGRLIVIVPNCVQTAEIFTLLAFNAIKTEVPEIAAGKQVGNILDALSQLSSSGDINCIKNNSDMKGHDAHTVPRFLEYLHFVFNSWMLELNYNKSYFCTQQYKGPLYGRNGTVIKDEIVIPSIVVHTARLYDMNSNGHELADRFFTNIVYAYRGTYPSGYFGTTGTHSIGLTSSIKYSIEEFNTKPRRINFKSSVLGDDIFIQIRNGWNNKEEIIEWSNILDKIFFDLNYEQEKTMSRWLGTFLQQFCGGGAYYPLAARTSLYCDERSETAQRDCITQAKILGDIIHVYGQRTYCHDNLIGFAYSMWSALRFSKYNKLKIKNPELDKYLRVHGPYTYIIMPLLFIGVSPINLPFPMILYDNRYTSPVSITSLGGDSAYIKLYQIFGKEEITTEESFTGKEANENMYDLVGMEKFGILFSIYCGSFNRTRRLLDNQKAEIGEPLIDMMVSNLNNYLDNNKSLRCLSALDKLKKAGLNVPFSLQYINTNYVKIEQSLLARLETLEEQQLIDKTYESYLENFSASKVLNFNRKFKLCAFEIYVEKECNLKVSSIGKNYNKVPIMPGYNRSSNYSALLNITGEPITNIESGSASIGKITAVLGTSFDVELAISFGVEVYQKDSKLLPEAAEAMGIPPHLHNNFRNLVEKALSELNVTRYLSIFSKVKFFAINGDMKAIRNNVNVWYKGSKLYPSSGIMGQIYLAVVRDIQFMYPTLINTNNVHLVLSTVARREWVRST
jgi:hypothetical protein